MRALKRLFVPLLAAPLLIGAGVLAPPASASTGTARFACPSGYSQVAAEHPRSITGGVDTSARLLIFRRESDGRLVAKVDNRPSGKTLLYAAAWHGLSPLGETTTVPAGGWCSRTAHQSIEATLRTEYANGASYCVYIYYPGIVIYGC